ncbi:beta-1,3-galactosyltransferase 1-like [Physella acuta]|uniref:beta-1,3-galactosyltransferase 1-like n=1 Tax=Physella acuta TaxID=109671 RepID=UPI0027DBCAEB|nr:beta-1,3-galactosyltransferase 1-like [Physella acuta]
MFEKRTVIRKTWGDNAWLSRNNVTLLFFIGRARGGSTDNRTSENRTSVNEKTQRLIEKEAILYRDIVQESYIDSYGNLSYKSLSIIKWVTTSCPHAKYILKADTDMYINIPLLVQTLKAHTDPNVKFNTFIMGQALPNSQPFRDPLSKWYVPYSRFNGSVYPNFVSGTAYALTTPAAKLLYEASMRVPFFWLEDVYLTGFCAVLANVTIIHSPLFSLYKLSTSGCAFRSMISGHEYSTSELETIHRELTNSSLVC